MKISDITIGSLIRGYYDEGSDNEVKGQRLYRDFKVAEINGRTGEVESEEGEIFHVDDCCGIPLTEEILKANDFVDLNATNGLKFRLYVLNVNQEYGDIWGRTNHKITIAWREINSDVYIERPYGTSTQQKIGVADIQYVYEFQHTLRLCGLAELADNFKIKEE